MSLESREGGGGLAGSKGKGVGVCIEAGTAIKYTHKLSQNKETQKLQFHISYFCNSAIMTFILFSARKIIERFDFKTKLN